MVGLRQNARLAKGALVQLLETVGIPIPNIISFQYNPETLTRRFSMDSPAEPDSTGRGLSSPVARPFDPEEGFSLTLELDATDDLEEGRPLAQASGVASRLASLEKLVFSTPGPLGQAAQLIAAAAGLEVPRATVPIVFFVFGPGRIVPVRVDSLEIEEELFNPSLFPIQAKATVGLTILRPSDFQCQRPIPSPAVMLAIAAYTAWRAQREVLAVANVANTVDAIRGLLPI
ncbi:hypothetical protein [Paraliomyxa miuraensis]|uniref:hypothetical protein n=1 Tax=Paraliomyxa miuraensis TaxID=376150 RepID=UPI00224EAB25|nr:hypothetical protein [Paraliomyxa miuraensis]MCX4247467.1 hypothetical protein [Paraliomyxa miuraensis]